MPDGKTCGENVQENGRSIFHHRKTSQKPRRPLGALTIAADPTVSWAGQILAVQRGFRLRVRLFRRQATSGVEKGKTDCGKWRNGKGKRGREKRERWVNLRSGLVPPPRVCENTICDNPFFSRRADPWPLLPSSVLVTGKYFFILTRHMCLASDKRKKRLENWRKIDLQAWKKKREKKSIFFWIESAKKKIGRYFFWHSQQRGNG